jgi:hypothetical protein
MPGDEARMLPQALPANFLGLGGPAGLAQAVRQRNERGGSRVCTHHGPQAFEAFLGRVLRRSQR